MSQAPEGRVFGGGAHGQREDLPVHTQGKRSRAPWHDTQIEGEGAGHEGRPSFGESLAS